MFHWFVYLFLLYVWLAHPTGLLKVSAFEEYVMLKVSYALTSAIITPWGYYHFPLYKQQE